MHCCYKKLAIFAYCKHVITFIFGPASDLFTIVLTEEVKCNNSINIDYHRHHQQSHYQLICKGKEQMVNFFLHNNRLAFTIVYVRYQYLTNTYTNDNKWLQIVFNHYLPTMMSNRLQYGTQCFITKAKIDQMNSKEEAVVEITK